MLCLSGFELYSRWVPLFRPAELIQTPSRTKFKRRKMFISVKLLTKSVIIIYALGSAHEKFGV